MKIKNVTTMAVRNPLSKNFGGSRYNVTKVHHHHPHGDRQRLD